jgi:hypothetical protein
MSSRIQPKELWKVVPQDGLEGVEAEDVSNPIVSLVNDTPPGLNYSASNFWERDARSSSSLIQTKEKSVANGLQSLLKSETDLKRESGDVLATDKQTSAKSGPLHLFAVVPGLFTRTLPLETSITYVWYCAMAIASIATFACFCCWMDWLRTVGKTMGKRFIPDVGATESGRSQYTHRGKVVYEWQQTQAGLTLFTQLPRGIKKKDIDVKVWPRHIKIGRIGKAPFIKEELFNNVVVNECKWDVNRNSELSIALLKVSPEDWPCVLKAHDPRGTK